MNKKFNILSMILLLSICQSSILGISFAGRLLLQSKKITPVLIATSVILTNKKAHCEGQISEFPDSFFNKNLSRQEKTRDEIKVELERNIAMDERKFKAELEKNIVTLVKTRNGAGLNFESADLRQLDLKGVNLEKS